MMYVICFYWQGDRWQQTGYKSDHINKQQKFMDQAGIVPDDLPAKYVDNLYRGVKRFAVEPFKFVCFTNEDLQLQERDIVVRRFPLLTKHGVLPRLFMFSKEAGLFGHQVLCLDLDVVIVGSLEKVMGYKGEFCTRSKFKPGEQHKLDGDIMSFQAGEETEAKFWKPFIKDIDAAVEFTQGRERYWVRHVMGGEDKADRWGSIHPNLVLSYKRHARYMKRLPEETSIVSCHGIPRPHQIKNELIKEHWI